MSDVDVSYRIQNLETSHMRLQEFLTDELKEIRVLLSKLVELEVISKEFRQDSMDQRLAIQDLEKAIYKGDNPLASRLDKLESMSSLHVWLWRGVSISIFGGLVWLLESLVTKIFKL